MRKTAHERGGLIRLVGVFRQRKNAAFFAPAIEDARHVIVPTISLFEVFKRVLIEKNRGDALGRHGMITLVLEKEPHAVSVAITSEKLRVDLSDGRSLVVPLEWYPRLADASPRERKNWRLLGDGYALEWPDLDEHIGIEGLLAGQRSGESQPSFERWLASRQRTARVATLKRQAVSPAKA
jgi:hypothetical protein